MPVPGAQQVNNGIMVDMSKLNQRTFNPDKSIASIGPGQVWIDVYQWLAKSGLAVAGGRYPTVGVGGYLVGGGISYFGSTKGWGCDNVVKYEVVLADGRVVEATSEGQYADLFWALRGGHNNFGIVTRFDMKTFPMTSAFWSATIWNGNNATTQSQFFNALYSYIAPGGGVDDPNVAMSPILAISPAAKTVDLSLTQFAPGNDANPAAFVNFTAVQGEVLQSAGGTVAESWTSLPQALISTGARGARQLFYSVSFAPDPRAIRIANETTVELAFAELADVAGSAVTFTYQPISKDWLKASVAAGGDALSLDPSQGTFIAGLIYAQWTDAADDATVHDFAAKAGSIIKKKTRSLGLDREFIYLNDAAPGQKPFETFGGGKSLPRLKKIQKKYDPSGFLENKLNHGFALE
jgi:FAD/FMN-containing dehydrogenase